MAEQYIIPAWTDASNFIPIIQMDCILLRQTLCQLMANSVGTRYSWLVWIDKMDGGHLAVNEKRRGGVTKLSAPLSHRPAILNANTSTIGGNNGLL